MGAVAPPCAVIYSSKLLNFCWRRAAADQHQTRILRPWRRVLRLRPRVPGCSGFRGTRPAPSGAGLLFPAVLGIVGVVRGALHRLCFRCTGAAAAAVPRGAVILGLRCTAVVPVTAGRLAVVWGIGALLRIVGRLDLRRRLRCRCFLGRAKRHRFPVRSQSAGRISAAHCCCGLPPVLHCCSRGGGGYWNGGSHCVRRACASGSHP